MIWFYLDDEWFARARQSENMITVPNYQSMIALIKIFRDFEIDFGIDFDHDLGEDKTGYDVAKFIVENNELKEELPIHLEAFHIHSANPVGVKNIRQLLTHYGYREV